MLRWIFVACLLAGAAGCQSTTEKSETDRPDTDSVVLAGEGMPVVEGPVSLGERQKVAKVCMTRLALEPMPSLVDELDDRVNLACRAWRADSLRALLPLRQASAWWDFVPIAKV